MKLTKEQLKLHAQALALLDLPRDLTWDERAQVLAWWQPAAEDVTGGGAFFTPPLYAQAVAMEAGEQRTVLDLCAGNGALAFAMLQRAEQRGEHPQVVCVEQNPRFIEVGRKVVPEAEWVTADAFNVHTWEHLGPFDLFITNPPFGTPVRQPWLEFQGDSAYAALEVGMRLCNGGGVAILPAAGLPYQQEQNRVVLARGEALLEPACFTHCPCCGQSQIVTPSRYGVVERFVKENAVPIGWESVGPTFDWSHWETCDPWGNCAAFLKEWPEVELGVSAFEPQLLADELREAGELGSDETSFQDTGIKVSIMTTSWVRCKAPVRAAMPALQAALW